MKLTNIFSISFLVFAVIMFNSCSSDDNNDLTPPKPDQSIEDAISSICLDWNSSLTEVDATMKGYVKISCYDDFISYQTKNGFYKVVYDFVDNKLRSAAVIVKTTEQVNNNQIYSLNGYSYIGDIDGAAIYTNESIGNMAMVLSREIDGTEYLTVGFTPIESNLYEKVEPICVELLSSTNVSTTSFTANWKVSGEGSDKYENCKIMISETSDMSSPKTYGGSSIGSGEFKATITGLAVNTIYYLQAYVTIDGVRYDSEVISQELEHIDTYKIGDFYPNEESPEGIVCRITGSGEHGTILSLDEDYLKWDVNGIFCTDYSSYNSSDGSKNNMGSTQPFAKWIKMHGTGWYGPAKNELCFSKSNLEIINKALSSKGYVTLDGFYWSSTQKNNNQSYVVTVTTTGYMGYSNQHSFVHQKDNTNSVRAMKKY